MVSEEATEQRKSRRRARRTFNFAIYWQSIGDHSHPIPAEWVSRTSSCGSEADHATSRVRLDSTGKVLTLSFVTGLNEKSRLLPLELNSFKMYGSHLVHGHRLRLSYSKCRGFELRKEAPENPQRPTRCKDKYFAAPIDNLPKLWITTDHWTVLISRSSQNVNYWLLSIF